MELETDPNAVGLDTQGLEDDESLNQTGFLLQRLRELQNWQREQEEKLLQEQEHQLIQVRATGSQIRQSLPNPILSESGK